MTINRLAGIAAIVGLALMAAVGCTSGSADEPDQASASSDAADGGPASPTRDEWVVSLGDSYISGEGVRWAGNTAGSPKAVDALGADAYFDKGRREAEPGCHRSEVSIADVGGGLKAKNLACSGATTSSQPAGANFKPGLDFYDDGKGNIGQALALQRFASTHTVRTVVVSIGGNDFNFSSVVATCATDFATTVGRKPSYCKDDPTIASYVDDDSVATVTANIRAALARVAGAMQRAEYDRDDYAIVVLNYPAPIAPAADLRYRQTFADRFDTGGCPVFDKDADWASETLLPTINAAVAQAVEDAGLLNLGLLDVSRAFEGHRLCEVGVAQLSDTSLRSWRDDGADGDLEWVNMTYTKGAPWQLQESFHPNYWGMLAEQACVRDAVEAASTDYAPCLPAA